MPILAQNILDGLPGNLPEKWSEPATWLLVLGAIGWMIREYLRARAGRRDADGKLIDNLQSELDRRTESQEKCERKNDVLMAEAVVLAKAHAELTHTLRGNQQAYDMVLGVVDDFGNAEVKAHLEEVLAAQRKRSTARRAARGDVSPPPTHDD